ncbi:MAG: hypothetical protein K2P88_00060 [Chitinophagaceae bacterium]|nr:hypothetical protein [Chitinophagaceae bacterium]
MKFFYTLSLLITPFIAISQNCHCDSLFLETRQLVEENYAGWFDKVSPKNKAVYQNWTQQKYLKSKAVKTDSTCAKLLKEWIGFFKDKHLRVLYSQPQKASTPQQRNETPIQIIKYSLTEASAQDYFKTATTLDPIEGIYSNANYKLAIIKAKPNLFYAVILSSQNENWTVGEVKLTIEKKGATYLGTFYAGDKTETSTHTVSLVDNVLDFDIVFFEKLSPYSGTKRDLTEYEISKDKDAPSLQFKNDLAIWTFPTFYSNSEEQTAFLLEKYKNKLAETPYWIIDLRNNAGGDYRVGWQLFPYIYSKPVVKYYGEMRLSKQNIELWFNSFVKNYYDQADDKTKKEIDDELAVMRSQIGKMYNGRNKATDTLQLAKILPNPKKIAILINENTISSGELFTMLAQQSDKVVVMGTNSGGMMDYGNVLRYKTTYPTIRIQIPIDRMLWLNTGFSVDKAGLSPQLKFKNGDWIEQAIQYLKMN